MATISPKDDFDAEEAAKTFKASMRGLGTDEAAIIDLLVGHDNAQRQEIKTHFTTMYGQNMEEELKSELGGEFEDAVLAFLTPPRTFDARQLNKAIQGGGTDEAALIEILVTRSNDELEEIKELYQAEFDNTLEEDLQGDTSGYIRRLLVSQCNAGREPEDQDVDEDEADKEAQEIYDAGEGQLGTEEAAISRIFCLRSFAQLRATFDVYYNKFEKTMLEVVSSETSGSLEDAYHAIILYARDPPTFFAERAYKSMKGAGTNDSELIRIIASRSEVDLEDIKDRFVQRYETTLAEFVKDDCAGDYKRLLLSVIGE